MGKFLVYNQLLTELKSQMLGAMDRSVKRRERWVGFTPQGARTGSQAWTVYTHQSSIHATFQQLPTATPQVLGVSLVVQPTPGGRDEGKRPA